MASVVLSHPLAVSKPGLKAVITFKKADCLTLGSKTYVCFKPNNAGLCQMMVEANGEKSAADIKTFKSSWHYSCWHSLGLQELIKLRNEAQVKALSEADGKSFHAQMKTLRDDHDALTVQVSIDGQEHSIDVLRPVHGRDRLWVLYEESSLGAVITYLRDMPFGDKLRIVKIVDCANGWIVKKKRDDGSVQHMFTKQLAAAALLVNSDAGARDGH